MRMILTAAALSAALMLAVINAVQARHASTHDRPTVTPIVVVGE